jgi:hypothetical protein
MIFDRAALRQTEVALDVTNAVDPLSSEATVIDGIDHLHRLTD